MCARNQFSSVQCDSTDGFHQGRSRSGDCWLPLPDGLAEKGERSIEIEGSTSTSAHILIALTLHVVAPFRGPLLLYSLLFLLLLSPSPRFLFRVAGRVSNVCCACRQRTLFSFCVCAPKAAPRSHHTKKEDTKCVAGVLSLWCCRVRLCCPVRIQDRTGRKGTPIGHHRQKHYPSDNPTNPPYMPPPPSPPPTHVTKTEAVHSNRPEHADTGRARAFRLACLYTTI